MERASEQRAWRSGGACGGEGGGGGNDIARPPVYFSCDGGTVKASASLGREYNADRGANRGVSRTEQEPAEVGD